MIFHYIISKLSFEVVKFCVLMKITRVKLRDAVSNVVGGVILNHTAVPNVAGGVILNHTAKLRFDVVVEATTSAILRP